MRCLHPIDDIIDSSGEVINRSGKVSKEFCKLSTLHRVGQVERRRCISGGPRWHGALGKLESEYIAAHPVWVGAAVQRLIKRQREREQGGIVISKEFFDLSVRGSLPKEIEQPTEGS